MFPFRRGTKQPTFPSLRTCVKIIAYDDQQEQPDWHKASPLGFLGCLCCSRRFPLPSASPQNTLQAHPMRLEDKMEGSGFCKRGRRNDVASDFFPFSVFFRFFFLFSFVSFFLFCFSVPICFSFFFSFSSVFFPFSSVSFSQKKKNRGETLAKPRKVEY